MGSFFLQHALVYCLPLANNIYLVAAYKNTYNGVIVVAIDLNNLKLVGYYYDSID